MGFFCLVGRNRTEREPKSIGTLVGFLGAMEAEDE